MRSTKVVPERGMPTISSGVSSLAPESGIGGEEIRCEAQCQPVDIGREGRPIEPCMTAADPVAGIEMKHRLAVFTQIIEQLADREMEGGPRIIRQRGILKGRPHACQPGTVRLGAFLRFDRGEMGPSLERVQLDDAVEGDDRLGKSPLPGQCVAQKLQRHAVCGIERHHLPQTRLGRLKIAVQHRGSAQAQPAGNGFRSAGSRAAEACRRFFVLARVFVQFGEIDMSLDQVRGQFDGPAIGRHGFDVATLPAQRHSEVVIRQSVIRQSGRQPQAVCCLLEMAATQQSAAERVVRFGVSGVEADRLAKGGDRGGEPAGVEQPVAVLPLPLGSQDICCGGCRLLRGEQAGRRGRLDLQEPFRGLAVRACRGQRADARDAASRAPSRRWRRDPVGGSRRSTA